jgi:N utilization substance protein A
MSSELFHTIEAIGREKGIDTEVIVEALEEAYAAATRKYYRSKQDFGARFDPKTGAFQVFAKHTVVEEEELMDPQTEIPVEEAREVNAEAQVGDVIETPIEKVDAPLTRIAAQAAKQVIYQKVKEAERELVFNEYHDRIGELLTGTVKRFDRGDMLVDLGRTEGVIPRREQSRAEHYNPGDRIRAVLVHVDRLGKGPQLILSRASELLVAKLFEMEVPEIYDETVQIVAIARDAGERSKVAVRSRDRDVDPVGACVGMKGSRVQAVIRELRGERIDIVQYDEDESTYVRHSLNPAVINRVVPVDYEDRIMEVIVGEDQLSLAIGKRGQNVRLASKLVGWNLDIKSEAEKKAEVEEEMERMARAMQELGSLPDIDETTVDVLLDAGFRTVEELTLASLDDLTSIEGIDEDTALDIHDAAETRLEELREEWAREEEEAAKRAAEEAAAAEAAADSEDADDSEQDDSADTEDEDVSDTAQEDEDEADGDGSPESDDERAEPAAIAHDASTEGADDSGDETDRD